MFPGLIVTVNSLKDVVCGSYTFKP